MRRRDDPFENLFRAFDHLGDVLGGIGDAVARAVDVVVAEPVERFGRLLENFPAGAFDPQMQAVYDWEDQVVYPWMARRGLAHNVSLDECRRVVCSICAAYGVHTPEVRTSSEDYATGEPRLITIPPDMRNYPVVLHEVAHALDQTFNPGGQGHGPGFVGFLLVLLQDYAGADRAWLLRTLRGRGILHSRIRRVPKRQGKARAAG